MYKLNNLPFDNIPKIIQWIRLGKPSTDRSMSKYKNFDLGGGDNQTTLIYTPTKQLVVTDPKDKLKVLQQSIYKDIKTGVGQGASKLYHRVCQNYIGIKRYEVADFLKKQQPYQLSYTFKHQVNKPILASYPNERWAIDLIDMSRLIKGYNIQSEAVYTNMSRLFQ